MSKQLLGWHVCHDGSDVWLDEVERVGGIAGIPKMKLTEDQSEVRANPCWVCGWVAMKYTEALRSHHRAMRDEVEVQLVESKGLRALVKLMRGKVDNMNGVVTEIPKKKGRTKKETAMLAAREAAGMNMGIFDSLIEDEDDIS